MEAKEFLFMTSRVDVMESAPPFAALRQCIMGVRSKILTDRSIVT